MTCGPVRPSDRRRVDSAATLRRTSEPPSRRAEQRSSEALAREIDERRRAECMAHIQSDAVQLALDLLVREPDIAGFFRVFIKTLVEECESHACGVWLLDDDAVERCELWMAHVDDRFYTEGSRGLGRRWRCRARAWPRICSRTPPGWTETIEYTGDDARLPEAVREFNRANGIESVSVAPLVLPTRNLGWVALSTGDGADLRARRGRRALLEAMARQATLALHQSRLAEQSRLEERRQAVLEERNRHGARHPRHAGAGLRARS